MLDTGQRPPLPTEAEARAIWLTTKEARADLVRLCVLQYHMSYDTIAAMVNASRNSIAGVCNRHNIRATGRRREQHRADQELRGKLRRPKFKAVTGAWRRVVPETKPIPVPTEEPPDTRYTLETLPKNGCKWAYGDTNFTFCGLPAQDGSSYCPGHHKRVWLAPKNLTPKGEKDHGRYRPGAYLGSPRSHG